MTADFGGKMMKNHFEIATPDTNFGREVLVEGSDDGKEWRKIQGGIFLFRVEGAADDKSFVDIPDDDQQYLRITAFYYPEESLEVKIGDVKAWEVVSKPQETMPVQARKDGVASKQEVSEITHDSVHRNLPLYRLSLKSADENFYRRLTLYGRNEESRVEKVSWSQARRKRIASMSPGRLLPPT